MCVRLALVVVLDLSSPRGGLGSRIAWGLPWCDFVFLALVIFVCSVRCRGKEIVVSLDYRLMDVVGHLFVPRYMFCLEPRRYKPVVSGSWKCLVATDDSGLRKGRT